MDTHDGRIVRHHRQSSADALAARRATCDRPFAGGVGRRNYDHNTGARSLSGAHAPIQHPSITEPFVLLGATEALPIPTRDNDRPYRFTVGWRRR